jgi:hypothetical protein
MSRAEDGPRCLHLGYGAAHVAGSQNHVAAGTGQQLAVEAFGADVDDRLDRGSVGGVYCGFWLGSVAGMPSAQRGCEMP